MKKRLKIFLGVIFLMAIVLVNFTYYSYSIKPPSEKWSKEVKVSSGVVKSNVKVLKFNGNYIIAHDDSTAIKVIKTDLTGKVLKENKIETGKFMNYITLFTDGDNLLVSYVEPNSDSGTLYTLTLDSDLKEIKSEETKDVLKVQQIDDDMLLLLHSDKLELMNPKTGVKTIENISTKLASGSKTSDGSYVICYREKEKFLGIKFKNNKIVERYDLGELVLMSGMAISSISSNADESNIYVLIEILQKGAYGKMQMITYDQSNKNSDMKALTIGNESFFYNAVAVQNSDSSAQFLINANDTFLDVTFKNNEIVDAHKATRMTIYASNIGENDNAIAFIDGGKLNDVYLASKDENFKQVNNVNRKEEAKDAFSISISHIINDIMLTPFYGFLPLFITAVPMVISTCIFYDSRHKKKRRVILLFSYIIMILLKLFKTYENCFEQYPGRLPALISNPVIFMGIMLLISSICMYLAYEKFEKDEYGIDIWTFLRYGLIDVFISTMFYLPYIV